MNDSNFYPHTSLTPEEGQSPSAGTGAPSQASRQSNFKPDDQDGGGFDIMSWVFRILHYWYLFVIGITVAFVLSHYQNRKWQPIYQTKATILIEDGKGGNFGGYNSTMQGFGVQSSYRNINNQIIIFGSHDLIEKALDRLPLDINCYTKGKYRTNDIYKQEPVTISKAFVSQDAYGTEFTISDAGDQSTYYISWVSNEQNFKVKGHYGIPLTCPEFNLKVDLNDRYIPKYTFYFQFLDKEKLIANYSSRLSFDFVMKGSSVVSVQLTGPSAQRDVDFINCLCECFIDQSLERKNEVASKTIDFIESQLANISDSLTQSEGRLKNYRISNQIVDISSYTSQLISDNRKFDEQFTAFRLKETYFNYLLNYLNSHNTTDIIALPSTLGISDATLNKYVQEYNTLLQKRSEMGEKNPYYTKYTNDLEQLRTNMRMLTTNMRSALNIEKQNLVSQTREVRGQISSLPDKESHMSDYERKFKIHDNYYSFLLQKRAESQVQKASNSSDNVILERAHVVSIVNGDVKGKTKTFYLAVGVLIPFLFILLKFFLNTKIMDRKDVEKYSPYPYFGSIRHTTSKSKIPVLGSPRSGLAEAYRIIRTRIEFIVQRQFPTMLLITSTESGDGKTTFALNFAAMYAHTKRKTVLVDLDLRKPSVIDRLELPNDKRTGISNYLIGQIDDFHELIIRDEHYNFDIISGGTVPPNPGELIRSEKLLEMFRMLQKEYDHIVIDTSPVGLVADAYALMLQVDINIFIVRSDKTNKNFFESILQQIKSDNVPNVYVVLNDIDQKKASYSNYHEYGRRSYYMKKDEYHNYTQEYFDDEEEEAQDESLWKKVKTKLKKLKREYY